MKISLQAKVSIFITLIIVAISAFSTYLFTTAHSRSKERGLIIRGTALSQALSKAAEEGLLKEDLSLIKKASYIIKTPDVAFAQVYSNIWEAIDAYPIGRLKDHPHPHAVNHFKNNLDPLHVKRDGEYDFYAPILFKAFEESEPVVVGHVRIGLSTAAIRKDIRKIVAMNIGASAAVTLIAVLAINVLISRLVVNPVMAVHKSISAFKNGITTVDPDMPAHSADEVLELSREFRRMREAIREKENRLIESERRIRSLFERVEHGIFRLDGSGNITDANSRFKAMFGDVTGLCDVLMGERSANECLKKASSERVLHIEDKAVGKTGDELVVSLMLYPDRDESGAVTAFDGYILDITEKRKLEERLFRAQKMEAVGTLAGGMAHDFNNLLTAILGYSGIILSGTNEGDPLHKPASIIHSAAKRGAEFGRKILTITRKEKLEVKPVDVNEIVKTSVELLHRSMPKNIEIVTGLTDGLPLTNADPSQMQQVIINLAVNARDAMPDGGKLFIETAFVSPENGFGGKHNDASGFIKLSVADTGVGIDTTTQTKIFDPFFTTKDVGQGTGLGLYIVHSIVNNHGGYINLYSEPQKGTRFNIYLPITKGALTEAPLDTLDIKGTGTILVIDDESDVRELCRDILTPLGYTVLTAESGATGIHAYRDKRDDISLVVLDMIMPKMGGTEVFNTLKAINPGAKILLYSGYSHNNFAGINELLKRGAVGFIQKPFSTHDIGIAIKKALSA